MIELTDHPFFLASQFHPEFQSKPDAPHPLFKGFIAAAHAQLAPEAAVTTNDWSVFDIFGDDSAASAPAEPLSGEEKAKLAELESRILKEEPRRNSKRCCSDRLKQRKADLEKVLSGNERSLGLTRTSFYRFYHGRFKVYGVQATTGRAVKLLGELLPERERNMAFDQDRARRDEQGIRNGA